MLALLPAVWYWQTRLLVIERHGVEVAGIESELRLVVIADTHLVGARGGPLSLHASPGYLRHVADVAARLEPDLLLFLGDLAEPGEGGEADAETAAAILGRIPARYGRFACSGNHDAWMELERIEAALEAGGFRVLDDEWTEVETSAGAVVVGGLGWRSGSYDPERMLADAPESPPRLLLCHDPAVAKDLRDASCVDLIVSGHTHGGQIWLPWIGAPWTPSRAIPEYVRGMHPLGPSTRLYVSRGIGANFLPVRLWSRPEVTLLLLEPGAA